MPVDFEIDHGGKRVIARASGLVALSDILTYLDAITVQDAAAYPKLFDAREAQFELRTYSVRPESAGRNMPAATKTARARISTQMEPRQRADGTSDDRAGAVPSEWKSL